MLSKAPFWLKITALCIACMTVMATLLALYADRSMRDQIRSEVLAAQQRNLGIAARILTERSPQVDLAIGADGVVNRVSLGEWPAFAGATDADHDFIDTVGALTSETATIFAYDAGKRDFIRRTTNIIKPDGSRAVGTYLGEGSAAYPPIMSGEAYLGTANILGISYETLYMPIFSDDPSVARNDAGVAGILYVGVKNAALLAKLDALDRGILLASLAIILVAAVVIGLICRAMLRPLHTAVGQMKRLAAGETVAVAVTRADELGQMQGALADFADAADDAFRQAQTIEQSDAAVMMADAENGLRISYLNPAATRLLGLVAPGLSVAPDAVEGLAVSALHPELKALEARLGNPADLPLTVRLRIADDIVDVKATALRNRDGSYAGPMLNWTLSTAAERTAAQFESDLGTLLHEVEEALATLGESTATLEKTAGSSLSDSRETAGVAEEASGAVQTVATAVEELNQSFNEIVERIAQNAQMAREASEATSEATRSATALEEAGKRITEVVGLIADVAAQTNLLALNATIEASRAGEAGRGFAVVASEVKALAQRAAQATNEVSSEVERVNAAGGDLLRAVQNVQTTIGSVDEVSSAVAATVEQQQATTAEISRAVRGVSEHAERVRTLASHVTQSSSQTGEAVGAVGQISTSLGATGKELGQRAQRFLEALRAAA